MRSALARPRFLLSWSLLVAIALAGWSLTLATTSCNATVTDSPTTTSSPQGSTAESMERPAVEPEVTADDTVNTADITVIEAAQPLTQDEIWQRLQQPEDALYVVLMRHALAPGTGDPANFQLEDCTTQRNLSDEGRAQAVQAGQAFRNRGVNVQQVLSSQWCRCLETAELMEVGEVVPFPPINSFFRDRNLAEPQTTAVKQYWLEQEDPGVIVMVTHQVNVTGLTGIVPQSGEAVVVQVQDDGFVRLGQLQPWT